MPTDIFLWYTVTVVVFFTFVFRCREEKNMVSFHKQVAPILFGEGAVAELYDRLQLMGAKKALICTDKGVLGSGAVDKAVASLKDNGFPYLVFDGCLPDAPEQSYFGCADLARSEGADVIIAIGGGSNMDAAKAASTMILKRPTLEELLPDGSDDPPPVNQPDVKLVLIPTTSGTGSEATFVAVVSNSSDHTKFGIMITGADLSIVDPELAVGMPPALTASTGMDVVAHACEAFTTITVKNPISDQRALSAMRLVNRWLPEAVRDGSNLEARKNMSLACTLAGMAFNDSMNNFGHGIAHALGTKSHMAHGLACALAEPAALESFAHDFPDMIKEIGVQFDAKFPENASPEEIGKATGNALRRLMKEVGIPSFEQLGMSREEVIGHRDAVLAEFQTDLAPIKVTPEVAEKVLKSMYDDYR
jgi:alcohol dehydrogenase